MNNLFNIAGAFFLTLFLQQQNDLLNLQNHFYIGTKLFSDHKETISAIFVGRTPCKDFSNDYPIAVNNDCFKLKWKLTLKQDANRVPAGYLLQTTFNRAKDITGEWQIVKSGKGDNAKTIFTLKDFLPGRDIYLEALDDNVLHFTDAAGNYYPGDAEYSYTLYRQSPN